MTYPIPGVPIGTPYGKRGTMWSCNKDSSGRGVHTGVDFEAAVGTDILAPIAGQIRHRNYGAAFGRHQFAISPDEGQPFAKGEVFFAHTSTRLADGVYVKIGQKIADVGMEGNTSGPHLHMEYHADTKNQWSCSTHDNPQPVLDHKGSEVVKYIEGIDVSSNNDDSWKLDTLWQFAFVKGTEGRSYTNPKYADQLASARKRSGGWGDHYHWLNAGDVGQQVAWAKSQLDVKPGEMIAVDWENDPENGTATCAQKDDAIRKLQVLYPYNRVGLYCNEDFWYNHDTTSFYGDFLWIAHPGGEPTIKTTWKFWQYDWGTDAKPLDRNRGAFVSQAALRTWAVKGTAPKPPDPKPPDPKPPVVKPGWLKDPVVKLSMAKVPGPVSYLQGAVRVAGVTVNGKVIAPVYVMAQDLEGTNTRFLAFTAQGSYINSMTLKTKEHGQSFHAYRSAAGNLYIWTMFGSTAYRIRWQPGKTLHSRSPGVEKMAYGSARPVGTYESFVGFRSATSTHETITLHDRFGFTDPDNNSAKPIKRVVLKKDMTPTQQSWAVSLSRVYRLNGATNTDAGEGKAKHVLDVFDWAGKPLLMDFDITSMSLPGATSDEPEILTFTGTPGSLLVGKRSGPNNHGRTVPIWQMTGLP